MTLLAAPARALPRSLQLGAAALRRLAAPVRPLPRSLQLGAAALRQLAAPAAPESCAMVSAFTQIVESIALAQLDFCRAENSGYLALTF